ncbi:MAG: cation-translocating P-type ATPase [Gemmatimonadales bacterium]|nr:MAG: cation-translocating P-type ATPase [Gemmatimonadales bacterium]
MTQSNSSPRHYEVSGLHCASCARSVEKGLATLDGVDACQLDFTSARLRLEGSIDADEVMERIRALGYGARALGPDGSPASGASSEPEEEEEGTPSYFRYLARNRQTWPALAGAVLLLPGLIFHEILHWEALWIELPALLALVLAGAPVVRSGWRGVRINREFNIQALITIAVLGALVIGAWVEAGMVVVLFAIGESLEGYVAVRARSAIRGLAATAPDVATRIRRGEDAEASAETVVPVGDLVPGDTILVRPGERIPMDGAVVSGRSTVDQAALTGESIPLEKGEGSHVLAGSVNGEGALEVKVLRLASETTLHRMIRMVEEAKSQRAPVERFIDRFARVYTPAVVVLAVLVAVVPTVLFGAPFWNPDPDTFGWFYRALALLVVACPCALVISVPASVVSAISNAARSGVLVKGGAHMEALAKVKAVAFDKTGTLTEGALTVVGVRSVTCPEPEEGAPMEPCEPCDDLLALAAAVEARSEHPIGRAVTLAARHRLLEARIPTATDHQALTGRGITASMGGRPVTIGSQRHMDLYLPREGRHRRDVEEDAREGRTSVVVEMEGRFLGTITLTDVPRETAAEAVHELQDMGIATVLLSGDSAGAARVLGERVGIEEVQAELLPLDKVRAIEEIRTRLGSVAMVGDGINDAPALAASDVGIAVGGDLGGTDQAREAAAVTLMGSDLRLLPRAIRLARATMRTVHVNVGFAIGIKLVFLALILAGMGTMWMAVLADVGATIIVTLYGMRLLRWGKETPPSATA